MLVGVAVIVSQYIGRDDLENANHTAGQLLTVSTLISALCVAAILLWNGAILNLLFGN